MVRHCVFPLCPNQMTSSSKFSFHRPPLDYPELLKLWLVALKMDTNIEVEELKRASHRVCSAHFAAEDFIPTKPKKKGKQPQRQNLKRTAIPIVSEGKTDAAEGSASGEQQDTKPPGQIGDTVSDVVQPAEDSLSNNTPETSTATVEKEPLQHIVDKEAILQLMKNCPMCDRACRCSKFTRGPYFIVYQSCYFCHYQRKWASQPEALNINIHKAYRAPKRKRQPKEKVCLNTKTQSSQLNNIGDLQSQSYTTH